MLLSLNKQIVFGTKCISFFISQYLNYCILNIPLSHNLMFYNIVKYIPQYRFSQCLNKCFQAEFFLTLLMGYTIVFSNFSKTSAKSKKCCIDFSDEYLKNFFRINLQYLISQTFTKEKYENLPRNRQKRLVMILLLGAIHNFFVIWLQLLPSSANF